MFYEHKKLKMADDEPQRNLGQCTIKLYFMTPRLGFCSSFLHSLLEISSDTFLDGVADRLVHCLFDALLLMCNPVSLDRI